MYDAFLVELYRLTLKHCPSHFISQFVVPWFGFFFFFFFKRPRGTKIREVEIQSVYICQNVTVTALAA